MRKASLQKKVKLHFSEIDLGHLYIPRRWHASRQAYHVLSVCAHPSYEGLAVGCIPNGWGVQWAELISEKLKFSFPRITKLQFFRVYPQPSAQYKAVTYFAPCVLRTLCQHSSTVKKCGRWVRADEMANVYEVASATRT